jgi:anti-sigma28 factor (negative regulator of flagellin synthesis)
MTTEPKPAPMPTPEREGPTKPGWYAHGTGEHRIVLEVVMRSDVLWVRRDGALVSLSDFWDWGPNIDDALARLAAYESENARLREQLVADDEAGREAILAAMRITPEQTLAVYQGMGKVPCAHCGELVEYPSATHWRSCEKHPARQEFLRLLEEVGRNEVFAGLADEERRSKECPPGFADCEESGYCTLSMMAAINVACALGLGDQSPLRKVSYVRAWEWVNTTLRLHRAAYDAAATSGVDDTHGWEREWSPDGEPIIDAFGGLSPSDTRTIDRRAVAGIIEAAKREARAATERDIAVWLGKRYDSRRKRRYSDREEAIQDECEAIEQRIADGSYKADDGRLTE